MWPQRVRGRGLAFWWLLLLILAPQWPATAPAHSSSETHRLLSINTSFFLQFTRRPVLQTSLVPENDFTAKVPVTESIHPWKRVQKCLHTCVLQYVHTYGWWGTHKFISKCPLSISSWNPVSACEHLSMEKNLRESSLQRKSSSLSSHLLVVDLRFAKLHMWQPLYKNLTQLLWAKSHLQSRLVLCGTARRRGRVCFSEGYETDIWLIGWERGTARCSGPWGTYSSRESSL